MRLTVRRCTRSPSSPGHLQPPAESQTPRLQPDGCLAAPASSLSSWPSACTHTHVGHLLPGSQQHTQPPANDFRWP